MKGKRLKSVLLCTTIFLFIFNFIAVQNVSSNTHRAEPVGGFVLPAEISWVYIFMLVMAAIAIGATAVIFARKRLSP